MWYAVRADVATGHAHAEKPTRRAGFVAAAPVNPVTLRPRLWRSRSLMLFLDLVVSRRATAPGVRRCSPCAPSWRYPSSTT